jgi:hypothetical protein
MKKKIFFIIITVLLLLVIQGIPVKGIQTFDLRPRKTIITFDSALELRYNVTDVLNATFEPNGPPVNIRLYVDYKIFVPNFLLRPPFMMLKMIYLFGKIYYPTQKIYLSSLNVPDWASVAIIPNPSDITISNIFEETTTILTIVIHHNAPAEPYLLRLKAKTPTLGRIGENQAEMDVIFQPKTMFIIDVNSSQTDVVTPPDQTTNISFHIMNLGNLLTLVSTNISEIPGWFISANPPNIWIEIGETRQITIQIRPPHDFVGNESIEGSFLPSHFLETGAAVPFILHAHYP